MTMTLARKCSRQTLALLVALMEQPRTWHHGYKLSKSTGLKSGTLYPILHGMERQGYLRSRVTQHAGRARRMYRATPSGRKALVTARKRVRELFGEMFDHD